MFTFLYKMTKTLTLGLFFLLLWLSIITAVNSYDDIPVGELSKDVGAIGELPKTAKEEPLLPNGYDGTTVGQLPEAIREELKTIIKNPWSFKRNCTELKPSNVKFILYTQDNPKEGIEVKPNKPEVLDRSKKIVMIIHGWLGTAYVKNIQEMKDAYLKRYDANVLLVDWNEAAIQTYTTAACEIPVPAQKVSNFLCLMSFRLDVPLSEVHVLGHSLGGHLAGVVGFNVQSKCNQEIGRVTGLDPTYAMFFRIPEKERLDETDGLFVDVMHTDPGLMGYSEKCGSVDFNPNCFRDQPNCISNQRVNDSTLVVDALCPHMRSLDYMTESVNSDQFIAVSCSLCPRYCRPDIVTETYAVMGEDCRKVPESRNFYIATNDTPPYALGWDAYDQVLNKKEVSAKEGIRNLYLP